MMCWLCGTAEGIGADSLCPACGTVAKRRRLAEASPMGAAASKSAADAFAANVRAALRTIHPLSGKHHSEATRAKMSAAQKGIPKSAEHRAKMSAAQKGKVVPPDVLAKRSAAQKGQKRTAEARANISASKIGHTVSDEARRKIGDANRGRTRSAETRAKMSAARSGAKWSEETRAKMRAAWERRSAASHLAGQAQHRWSCRPADPTKVEGADPIGIEIPGHETVQKLGGLTRLYETDDGPIAPRRRGSR
jgi:hypothetical protein